ncbi:hypothetical protein PUN28_015679 [Cardiocondyla obscurior]|uniref:Uncharacterized protein n=1 Tax=Cardiocondyla obscurior TaxID=286306 RepID=A0AAW2EZI5_9HYME
MNLKPTEVAREPRKKNSRADKNSARLQNERASRLTIRSVVPHHFNFTSFSLRADTANDSSNSSLVKDVPWFAHVSRDFFPGVTQASRATRTRGGGVCGRYYGRTKGLFAPSHGSGGSPTAPPPHQPSYFA